MRRFFASLLFVLLPMQGFAFATFNVNSPDDTLGTHDKCTLRAALQNINSNDTSGIVLMPGQSPNPDCPAGQAENFIYFKFPVGPSGYPEIARDPLQISWNLIKNKAVLVGVLLNGQKKGRIFHVGGQGSLELEHVWLEQGGGGGSGTAILVDGTESASLLMSDVRVVRNEGNGYGAAVAFTSYGELTISKSYFGANTTSQYGGALWVGTTTTPVSIIDSTFESNQAGLGGGAVVCTNADTPVLMRNVSLRSNEVTGGLLSGGGAIANSCKMTLSAVEIANNRTGSNPGGGIDNFADGRLVVSESSVFDNVAGRSASSDGGGIHSEGELYVAGTGFRNNTALRGGAISIAKAAGNRKITIANSTFVKNVAADNKNGTAGYGGALFVADVPFKPTAEFRFHVLNNTMHDNSGAAQLWLEQNGGTEVEGILFLNNLMQASSDSSPPNCAGRVERLKLERKTGQGVFNTQYPGATCNTPTASMPVSDVGLGAPKNGGNFASPYLLPPGGAGGLPTGDYVVCAAVIVNSLDQFNNKRLCRQGAVESPPTFERKSTSLPF